MDKNDYLRLKESYFEACLTPKETRALKEYVGQSDDADFDDVRAVLSYMSTGREVHRKQPASQRRFRPLGIMALAASLAVVLFLGIRLGGRKDNAIPIAQQPSEDILAMEQALTIVFSHHQTDIESQLSNIFTP